MGVEYDQFDTSKQSKRIVKRLAAQRNRTSQSQCDKIVRFVHTPRRFTSFILSCVWIRIVKFVPSLSLVFEKNTEFRKNLVFSYVQYALKGNTFIFECKMSDLYFLMAYRKLTYPPLWEFSLWIWIANEQLMRNLLRITFCFLAGVVMIHCNFLR